LRVFTGISLLGGDFSRANRPEHLSLFLIKQMTHKLNHDDLGYSASAIQAQTSSLEADLEF
jgi:hypothetical protein